MSRINLEKEWELIKQTSKRKVDKKSLEEIDIYVTSLLIEIERLGGLVPTGNNEDDVVKTYIIPTKKEKVTPLPSNDVIIEQMICLENYGSVDNPSFIKGKKYDAFIAAKMFLDKEVTTISMRGEGGQTFYFHTNMSDYSVPGMFEIVKEN